MVSRGPKGGPVLSFKVDGLGANLLPHLDAVACAVLANGGGHAHQVGLMLGMQRILD